MAQLRNRLQGTAEHQLLLDHEYVDILAKRVLYSRAHSCLCSTMILAGIVEVVWVLLPHGGVGQLPEHPCFILVETYVTMGLIGDIVLRAALQRGAFLSKWSNILDIVVAVVSVLSSALFAAGLETPTEMALASLLVVGRIIFRLLRLVALTKTFQQQQQAADRKLEVDFNHEEQPSDLVGYIDDERGVAHAV